MSAELSGRIVRSFEEHIANTQQAQTLLVDDIAAAGELIWNALLNQNKLLLVGNGGSAAAAQHMAALLVNRYEFERPGLPAIALAANGAILTSLATDYPVDEVFERQVHALGQRGDVLIALTTSGRSATVLLAIEAAHARGMQVLVVSGRDGGNVPEILRVEDLEIRVPAWSSARVREVQMLILHCLCDLIDHQIGGTEG